MLFHAFFVHDHFCFRNTQPNKLTLLVILIVSTQLLCQMAELEDGTKAFSLADAPNLQRELPENVLNEIELFLFNIKLDTDTAKKD